MWEMNRTNDFWRWFEAHERRVSAGYPSQDVIHDLDEALGKVHPELGWEIGPVESSKLYLAISPDLREDLLGSAQEFVQSGYTSGLWDFRVGRQRRPWNDLLELLDDESGNNASYNLKAWKHIVFKVPDSDLLDVVFVCGDDCAGEEDDLDELGAILAMGLIGELEVMRKVDAIEVVRHIEGPFKEKLKPAAWLPYAFGLKPQ